MKILLYGNGGSGNHGCEAIVRGTAKLLPDASFRIHSASVEEDTAYGLDQIAALRPAKSDTRIGLKFLHAYLKLKLRHDYSEMDALPYLPAIREAAGHTDLALSVGGDNYCYGGTGFYAQLNRLYHQAGIHTALWGCSIEPEVAAQPEVAADLASYDFIAARESITYEAVKSVQKNTFLAPDPAFFMDSKACSLDTRLQNRPVIGINMSPLIVSREAVSGMAYENYKQLIAHILEETDAVAALIPHVVWNGNDDRTVLRRLYEDFGRNERLVLVEDHTAPELKYIISRCSFFVGARTHATIAAYSTGVPTLVVGYSVKARGIARDLFGTEEGYVLPVQDLKKADQLTTAFDALYHRRDEISSHLAALLPRYLSHAEEVRQKVEASIKVQ